MLGTFSNEGLGMGVAFTLEDQYSQTAAKIEMSMSKLSGYTDALGNSIERSMNRMKLGFGLALAGSALLAPIAGAVSKAMDYEQTVITFETLLGSVQKAKDMLTDLKTFAANTPFEFQDVTEYTKRLLAMGIQSKDVLADMKALGDIAAGVGQDKLPQLILAFGQVNTKGKLAGGELRQFAESGVPLIAQLAKNLKVAQSEIGDMASKGEISFQQVRKALYDLTSGTGQFSDLMDKQSHSARGMWSNIKDNIFQAAVSVGEIFLPYVKQLFEWIGKVVTKFKEFAASPAGAFIVKMIAVIGILLVSLGTLLMLLGAVRFAIYKMTEAFAMATRATILQAFATGGLTAGLWAMAVAVWAVLWPVLLVMAAIYVLYKAVELMKEALKSSNPYVFAFGVALMLALGPIGMVIGAFVLLKRAIKEFDDTKDGIPEGGFVGWLQKVGGLIRGVAEIWASWDDKTKTFSLSDNVYQKLKSLGLLETVLNIGSWIIRIKTMFAGVKDGFIEGITWIKQGLKDLADKFQPIYGGFVKWGVLVEKNASSMEKWRDIGRKVGIAIVVILGALLIILGLVAAAVVFVGVVVGAVFYAIYFIIVRTIDLFKALYDAVIWFWDGLKQMFSDLVDWFVSIPDRLYDGGVRMVDALWNGIRNKWADMKAWIASAWETIKNMLGFTGDGAYMQKLIKIEQTREAAQEGVFRPADTQIEAIRNNGATVKAAAATARGSNSAPTVIVTEKKTVENVTIQANIDGRKMAEHVVDIQKKDNARR